MENNTSGRIVYSLYIGNPLKEISQMQDDTKLMSVNDLAKIRIHIRDNCSNLENSWKYFLDNDFICGNAIIYHPSGDIKISSNVENLKKLVKKENLRRGAIVISNEIYESLDGIITKKDKINNHGVFQKKEDVLLNPTWNYLIQDKKLLEEYVNFTYEKTSHEIFNFKNPLEIYSGDCNRKNILMKLISMETVNHGSCLDGRFNIDEGTRNIVEMIYE